MFFNPKRSSSAAEPSHHEDDAALAAFASETDAASKDAASKDAAPQRDVPADALSTASPNRRRAIRVANWIAVLALSGGVAGAAGTWEYKRRTAARTAFLSIETSVPGVEVAVGGQAVGQTPVALWLQPGSHRVSVGQGTEQRDVTVELAAGRSVFRHFDFGPAGPAGTAGVVKAASGGPHLRIETGSAPMAVAVDGVERGMSPLTVEGLAAGAHDVVVRGAAGTSLRHKVTLRAGESTVLVLPSAAGPKPAAAPTSAAAPVGAGWLAVTSHVPVQIRESGKVVGSTEADRLMLPTGEHALEFINEPLGYRARRSVRIEAGKTTALQLERVNGVLSINAQPWAEVWIDGERVGETPIGNLSRAIGTHEVVLRHPQLGERRERVTITAHQPARLGVDLRRK